RRGADGQDQDCQRSLTTAACMHDGFLCVKCCLKSFFVLAFRTLLSILVPLARYEHGPRRINAVCRCETGLVERKAGSAAGTHGKRRLLETDLAEGVGERNFD